VSHDRDFLDRVVTSVIASEGEGRWVEYAGGYSDMLAQRGSPAPAASAATKPRRVPATKPQPTSQPRRMTFKDRHALDVLPDRIAKLQADVARLNSVLADPLLYARDQARFDETVKALASVQEALAAAEAQWLSLEMLREELEG
jgi:ABC transport system ATP-binding/permease protein